MRTEIIPSDVLRQSCLFHHDPWLLAGPADDSVPLEIRAYRLSGDRFVDVQLTMTGGPEGPPLRSEHAVEGPPLPSEDAVEGPSLRSEDVVEGPPVRPDDAV